MNLKTLMHKIGRALLWLPRLLYYDFVNIIRNFKPRDRL